MPVQSERVAAAMQRRIHHPEPRAMRRPSMPCDCITPLRPTNSASLRRLRVPSSNIVSREVHSRGPVVASPALERQVSWTLRLSSPALATRLGFLRTPEDELVRDMAGRTFSCEPEEVPSANCQPAVAVPEPSQDGAQDGCKALTALEGLPLGPARPLSPGHTRPPGPAKMAWT